jgi:hypothetical protein
MDTSNEELQILARRLGEDHVSSRADLEAKLALLLSLVLRTGRASPSLLQWVRRALPAVSPASHFGDRVDPESAAPRLARLLCLQLIQGVRAQRDSLVKGQTVVGY